MCIIIGADLVPTKTNIEYFAESNPDVLFGNEFLDISNKLSGYRLKKRVPLGRQMAIENYLMCEAHNELFKEALKNTRTE